MNAPTLRPPAGADAGAWTRAVFAAGDYAGAAMFGCAATWQHHAALAMLRGDAHAFAALAQFGDADARLHLAAARWIHGDTEGARAALADLQQPHAVRLRALLAQPRIRVLAQLPWLAGTPQDLLGGAQQDPAFELRNVGHGPNDLPQHPYASVARYVDDGFTPDFYLAAMVEWQHVPPDLQRLACPIFGHVADHDLHAQTVLPWLSLYDELCVTDRTEWLDVQGLCGARASSFPKVFGLPADLPPVPDAERHLDCFVSGTMLDPYHPDKAALLHELLSLPDVNLRVVRGFTGSLAYRALLAASKASFTYVRRAGAMPTRGLEALAMGCALAVQEESSLRLYVGEPDGAVAWGPTTRPFAAALREILADWPHHAAAARRGAELVRAQFAMPRVASQYLRFLTFRAAAERSPRVERDTRDWCQKRVSVSRTWLPPQPAARRRTMQANFQQLGRVLSRRPTVAGLLDLARELLCEFAFYDGRDQATADERALFDDALGLLQRCERLFPDALVPRFVRVRALLHHGDAAQRLEGLQLAWEAVERGAGAWQVAPDHDVMPFDFHGASFDYRAWLDLVMQAAKGAAVPSDALVRPLLAALAAHVAAKTGKVVHHERAVAWHPSFAPYRLGLARALLARGGAAARPRALALLRELAAGSCEFPAALRLLHDLDPEAAPPLALQRLASDTLDTAVTTRALFGLERRAPAVARRDGTARAASATPSLSVLVPDAATAAGLGAVLAELAGQSTARALEIVVAAPPDANTFAATAASFAPSFAAVPLVPVPATSGHGGRLEALRRASTAPHLTIVGTGSRLRPDAFALLLAALDEHSADVAYGNDGWTRTTTAHFEPAACDALQCWPAFAPRRLERQLVIGLHAVWRRGLHAAYGGFADVPGDDAEHAFWRRTARALTVHQSPLLLASVPLDGAARRLRCGRRPAPRAAALFAPGLGDEAVSHARLGILDERTLQDVRGLEEFYGTALLHDDVDTAVRLLRAAVAAVPSLVSAPLALARLLRAIGAPGSRAVLEAARGHEPYTALLARHLAALPPEPTPTTPSPPCRTPPSLQPALR